MCVSGLKVFVQVIIKDAMLYCIVCGGGGGGGGVEWYASAF